ncbi:adenosylcobinamide-GDP ribazoletransferase [Aliibacillus thermotolerans]|uniref:Adenosylcobinamide-GDP ribazoletransferase n=1 Tax=Aliibacillus thermotolerans TaxID=1834418 RepID=A0ABW0U883_9BACI|nr:adenosylcobinamide-GDP ribazoletransferase [Aliibacillus thermotolerans]MDA3128664.1 adenosylcobinamide-GDP ribazoletransferase [Aliibacillus thermotolerans]
MQSRGKYVLQGFFVALAFLTIYPSKQAQWTEQTSRYAIFFFPVCGLLIGVIVSLLAGGLLTFFSFPSYLTAFFIMACLLLSHGGLHLDGWMDVSDALGSWRTKEERLEIMKDSRAGSVAVWSTILLLLGRFVAILYVVESSRYFLFFALLLLPFLSRGGMAYLLITAPLAKKDGLAAYFQAQKKRRDPIIVLFLIVFVLFLFIFFSGKDVFPFILVLLTTTVASFLFAYVFFKRIFGGINGDTLGAFVEGVETGLWFVSVLYISFVMG